MNGAPEGAPYRVTEPVGFLYANLRRRRLMRKPRPERAVPSSVSDPGSGTATLPTSNSKATWLALNVATVNGAKLLMRTHALVLPFAVTPAAAISPPLIVSAPLVVSLL